MTESCIDDWETLEKSFLQGVENVEKSLKALESSETERYEKRKKLIRSEHTRLLLSLNCRDGEAVRLLKSATMEALLQSRERANELMISAKKGVMDEDAVCKAKKEYKQVLRDIEYLRRNTELNVGVDLKLLSSILEQAFYEKTRDCDPNDYALVVEQEDKLVITGVNPDSFNNQLIHNTLFISAKSVNCRDESSRIPLVQKSLHALLRSEQAVVVNNVCHLKLPSSPTGFVEIDVTILGVPVKNGYKRRVELKAGANDRDTSLFLNDSKHPTLSENRNPHESLDQSDLRSLDMTKRTYNSNGYVATDLKVSNVPRALSVVAELTEPSVNTEHQWSPMSDAQCSTMRPTSANQFGHLLANLSEELPDPEASRLNDENVLEPSNDSERLSVHKMQNSLSRENSPIKGIVDVNLEDSVANRSIRFNQKTSIFQELPTPQVKVDKKRFSVKEGDTKVEDGIAGSVKRKIKPSNTQRNPGMSIWSDDDDEEDEKETCEVGVQPYDPVWDGPNVTIHAQERMLANQSSLECTLWETESDTREFNFLTSDLKPLETKTFDSFRESCMESPAFMTWIPKHEVVLITEPYMNRVGVYGASDLEFKGWFPKNSSSLETPLHILHLTNGRVVLVQRSRLSVYCLQKQRYREQNTFLGKFRGLAEGEDASVITVEIRKNGHFVRIFSFDEQEGAYKDGDSVSLNLSASLGLSKPQPNNLAYRDGKVYITDMRLGRLYIVDLNSGGGALTTHGYHGDSVGNFKSPLAVILDDAGNILIGDNTTSKLMVFDSRGQFIKDIPKETHLVRPMCFIRQGNSLLLSYMGENETLQGVVRYVLEPQDVDIHQRKDSPFQVPENCIS